MNRVPREHINGAVFYVTSRADDNRELFKNDADYVSYAGLLKKYKEQYGFKLFAFVFMPTHLHLLIELKEGLSISDIMHDLNSNYIKYFNSRYQKKGHLFQERSKITIAEKENYLLALTSYIHLNPQALDITKNAADYVYSSYSLYLNIPLKIPGVALDMGQEVKEALGLLKGRPYADIIAPADMKFLAEEIKKKSILGSAEFVAMIERKLVEPKVQAVLRAGVKPGKLVYAAGLFAAALIVIMAGLIMQGIKACNAYKEELARSNAEISQRLSAEKQNISRDLEEKYRADQVSYQAMAKRLELEKKRIAELEKKAK